MHKPTILEYSHWADQNSSLENFPSTGFTQTSMPAQTASVQWIQQEFLTHLVPISSWMKRVDQKSCLPCFWSIASTNLILKGTPSVIKNLCLDATRLYFSVLINLLNLIPDYQLERIPRVLKPISDAKTTVRITACNCPVL